MNLLTQLNSILEGKKKPNHSFKIKDWDIFALATGNDPMPSVFDAEAHYNINIDGEIEDLELLTVGKVDLLNSDEEVVKTLPAGSDVFKISKFTKEMDDILDNLIWDDYMAWVKYQRDNP